MTESNERRPQNREPGRTRRTVIRDAGIAGIGLTGLGLLGCGGDSGGGSSTTPATVSATEAASSSGSTPACTLSPEMTEGPYYVDLERIRADVTEDRPGLPLELEIKIVARRRRRHDDECQPLSDAAVDIWHADAGGTYSGIDSEGTTGETYLRGVQLTGTDGVASFQTIVPGWYPGRVTHIHLKVHEGGTAEGGTYSGGQVAHTGQLFFADKQTDAVYGLDPYADREGTRTPLSADSIYLGGDGARVHLTQLDKGDLRKGLRGRITLGVDPDAEPAEGVGGGTPPSGAPPAGALAA